jgi:hypothetical protein
VSAYLVSEATGWDVVPPTSARRPFGTGMCQLWVDVDERSTRRLAQRPPGPAPDGRLRRGGEQRRPQGRPPAAAPDGRVLGVDHGVCFSAEDKLRTLLWQWRGPAAARTRRSTVLSGMRAQLRDRSCEALHELLTVTRCVHRRAGGPAAEPGAPAAGDDWPAIPGRRSAWPYARPRRSGAAPTLAGRPVAGLQVGTARQHVAISWRGPRRGQPHGVAELVQRHGVPGHGAAQRQRSVRSKAIDGGAHGGDLAAVGLRTPNHAVRVMASTPLAGPRAGRWSRRSSRARRRVARAAVFGRTALVGWSSSGPTYCHVVPLAAATRATADCRTSSAPAGAPARLAVQRTGVHGVPAHRPAVQDGGEGVARTAGVRGVAVPSGPAARRVPVVR